MSESPYAVPEDELVASARVPAGDQVEEQSFPRLRPEDWSSAVPRYGDEMSGDADGE